MIQQWLDEHFLPCNYSKTKYMLLRMPNKPDLQLSLFMGDAEIDRVPEVKFLGLTIHQHLSWTSQVDDCCKRLCSAVFALRSLSRECSSRQALLMVFHGLFMSIARYGILAWGATSESNMNRVLVMQKRAVRIVAGLGWRESCREAFKQMGLLTIPSTYILEAICFCLEKTDSPLVAQVTGRVTRRAADIYVSPSRTHRSDCNVLRQGRILFNALPVELKAKRNDVRVFKRSLKAFLVDGAFYSVREFKRVSGGMG
jgi:hypothetical protein